MDWQLIWVTSLAARYTPGWETTHNFGRFHHCSLFPVGNEKGQWVKILDSKFDWWKTEDPGSMWFLSINRSHNVTLSHSAVTKLILTSRRTTFLETKTRSLNLVKVWKFPSLIIPWISSDTRSINIKSFFFQIKLNVLWAWHGWNYDVELLMSTRVQRQQGQQVARLCFR